MEYVDDASFSQLVASHQPLSVQTVVVVEQQFLACLRSFLGFMELLIYSNLVFHVMHSRSKGVVLFALLCWHRSSHHLLID